MATPHEGFVFHRLSSKPQYVDWFKQVFPNDSNPLSHHNVPCAISSFERTLLMPSGFDEFMKGD